MIPRPFYEHSAAMLLVGGNAAHFATIVLLRQYFSAADFGVAALLFTVMSLLWSFGLLGYDHTIIRFARTEKHRVYISRPLVRATWISATAVAAAALPIFWFVFRDSTTTLVGLLITVALQALLFLSLIYRINRQFTLSQVFASGWKLALALVTLAMVHSLNMGVDAYVKVIASILILIAILGFPLLRYGQLLRLDTGSSQGTKNIAMGFFASIALTTLLNVSDRFIVDHLIGTVGFGRYFYYATVLALPFGILQSYVGFRLVAEYRLRLSKGRVLRDMLRAFACGLLIAIALLGISRFSSIIAVRAPNLDLTDFPLAFAFVVLAPI